MDEERGVVLSMVRIGRKDGPSGQGAPAGLSRIVGEFFAVKRGWIQEVRAVLLDVPEASPTQWPADYGPGRGGVGW